MRLPCLGGEDVANATSSPPFANDYDYRSFSISSLVADKCLGSGNREKPLWTYFSTYLSPREAKKLAKLANLSLPDPDLAYFVAGTDEFAAYWRDLQWAQNYAPRTYILGVVYYIPALYIRWLTVFIL